MTYKNIGKEFIEKTKYKYLSRSDQGKGAPSPPLELPWDENAELIELSRDFSNIPQVSLKECITNRRSLRKYAPDPISLLELSWLLWSSQGIKEFMRQAYTLRTVPSAGARHAFETFLLINNVDNIEPGLYRYIASKHSLMPIDNSKNLAEKFTKASYNQSTVKRSAVTFFWVAVPYRMAWRYGERGYRYLFLDAGHVCQNLYLASENIDCGTCAIGAFHDDELNKLLNINGKDQFVIYAATVGKKPQ
ncbi:MAG: SagB/ThcOx family dehydrogenase [Candidatus Heimdallarchaeum aukensis]|uniref:SagB/ThcOx family dehydrogenase n=1 Tax=Candidatus Heimdallarchaeum aukensis TaxID=2876573 RepID=A0A9Y1BNF3_9ARCH|nr:MAG: SagB/ThcOx family dehydrogenase [Candidatus Heimdallarchaeum aukensis]